MTVPPTAHCYLAHSVAQQHSSNPEDEENSGKSVFSRANLNTSKKYMCHPESHKKERKGGGWKSHRKASAIRKR